jgi:small-conductance mechanosensitive channel
MLKKILNKKILNITMIFSGLIFFGEKVNSSNPEKKLSLISIIDPVSAANSIANEIISSANIYEQRQIYRTSKKKDFESLLAEKQIALKNIAESKKALVLKKQEFLHKTIDSENILTKINLLLDSLSEQEHIWGTLITEFEDHFSALDNLKDLFTEDPFKKRILEIEFESKFIPDDLFKLEQEIISTNQMIEACQQKKYASYSSRIEHENNLESFKKDESELKKRESKTVKKGSGKDLISENILFEYDKEISSSKKDYLSLLLLKSTSSYEFSSKELELLKFKIKKLEEIEKKIKPKLKASAKDVEEKHFILQAEEQKLIIEKENIGKEIDIKKKQRDLIQSELSNYKSKLRARKDNLVDEGLSSEEISQEVIALEIKVLKLRYDSEHLESQLQELNLKKKQKQFFRDDSLFRYLQVQEMLLRSNSNNDEKEFAESLKTIKEAVTLELKNQQEHILLSIVQIDNLISGAASTKKTELKKHREELIKTKNTVFCDKRKSWQEISDLLSKAEEAVDEQIKIINNMRLITQTITKQKNELIEKLETLRKDINSLDGLPSLWRRSSSAITRENLEDAVKDIESFVKKWFWESKDKLNPLNVCYRLLNVPLEVYLGFLIMLFIFLISSLMFYFLLKKLRNFTNQALLDQSSKMENRYALFLLIGLNLSIDRFIITYAWIFIHLFIKTEIYVFSFSFNLLDPYYLSLFYLGSALFWINTSSKFLGLFRSFNKKMNYFFFSERTTIKNMILLSSLFYSTVLIFSLWATVSSYSLYFKSSVLGVVLMAAHRLLFVVTLFLFLDRDDVIGFIPRWGYLSSIIHSFVDRFFYYIFFFFTGIYIIFSPYVGYSCLGWYLSFTIPLSVLIIVGGYFLQTYNGTFTQHLFFAESDIETEVVERFENARMFYGTYILVSFVLTWITVYAMLSRFWTGDFNLWFLWRQVSETLTVSFGEKGNFGLVHIFKFLAFVFGGYFVFSFFDQVVLKRIFDIFKIEAGLENTISKICQYVSIVLSVILGLAIIDLSNLIPWFFTALLVGVTVGAKEQIADIFAGILILLERQIEKDKTNYRGSVHKMSIRSTTIRTVRNFFVSVPNKLLISRPIINWGAGRAAVGMEFNVKVAFGADPEEICALIKKIIYENPSIMKVPAALVRLEDFSEFGMVFFARGFLNARRVREQWDIAANIRLEIIKTFKAKNITLAYPNHVVHIQHDKDISLEEQAISIRLDEEDNQ